MTIKSNKFLNNSPQSPSLPPNDPNSFGVKSLRPNYRWLDLIDTERIGQKTYKNKTHFMPTVYRGVGDIDIGLELVNYFSFSAELGPSVPISGSSFFTDIRQSYSLPSPFPNLDLTDSSYIDLSPISYDGLGLIYIKTPGLYRIGFDFECNLSQNIGTIKFEVVSNLNGVILSYILSGSHKTYSLNGFITSGTDSLGGSISGNTSSPFILNDLSYLFSIFSGNKSKNVYIEANEELQFKFTVVSVGGIAVGEIVSSNIFLSYLRPNR